MPRAAASTTTARSKKAAASPVAAAPKASRGKKAAVEPAGKITKTKGKRTKKDPRAPKRALSAYMFFSQAKRAEVREKNPNASFGSIGKMLGDMWKGMSEADKIPYVKLAEKDKVRYDAAKEAYAGDASD
ncbi:Non-histone chromosomal protein 6 [Coemansia spiralis]|uniref:Non-histone chromosomal protein 6 n=2 Tax=Coemansia TaxID=4863 RepID=A0A9W8G9R5_9FUNG|nr:Non-histone chromosomal protein 6 [Coemansia umbellata]KAJ2622359.1 Non-histone chromosomal protein 6 [Coemansia sp. RSA 1358]KAJ2677842.1 Non-histone chromosomal protein 6 [Coemansia spiralis]